MCPTRFETKGTETELVMNVDHFCLALLLTKDELEEWLNLPPATASPIETGVYKQGSTPFCWAMIMHTQARAFKAGKQTAYYVSGDIGQSFVGPLEIRWRPVIGDWCADHADKQSTR